jgi:hypothetical protein
MTSLTANYDESWKEALTEYFDSFLAFFFAEIYQQKFEETRTMPLLSHRSLRGMERGKEIGALQNARASVKAILTASISVQS